MNRRSVMQVLAGAPFIGKRVASDLVQGGRSSGGEMGADAGRAPDYPPSDNPNKPVEPRMPRWQAARLVLGDPQARADTKDALYQRHRVVHFIDADIEIMRSWSPMAKIAFQRQRNVERDLADMTREPSDDLLEKLSSRIRKLVWGS